MDRCSTYREALSAFTDGEECPLDPARLDAHLATCPGCRRYQEQLPLLGAMTAAKGRRRSVSPVRTHELLVAMRTSSRPRRRVASGRRAAQAALAAVAVAQLMLVAVDLLGGGVGHVARDLVAFEVALAVGFLTAAVSPERAGALLPMAGALVGVLAVVVGLDLVAGRAALQSEVTHLAELVGVVLLAQVARAVPGGPRGRARPA